MTASSILKKLNSRDTRLFPSINTLTKIVFIALIAITITFFAKNILAATYTPNTSAAIQKYKDKQEALGGSNNQESWMNEAIMSNSMSLNQAMVGTVPDDVLDGKVTVTSWIPGGIIGITNQSIASLYNRPASGIQYIAQTVDNFLGKPVYAQEGAINGLTAILPIWKVFRNSAYILFSIIFISIGVAIMLRVKISPQAVITIQSSIPKIITSLILVTFSYAIAGLLIDLSYLFQGVFLSILFNSKNGVSSTLFPGDLINPTFSQLMKADFWDINGLATKAVPVAALTAIAGVPAGIIAGVISAVTFGAGFPVAVLAGSASFILIFLIILIMILIYTIKFFFGMIKCYINIILKIILAPLEIALGAIPNMKMGFSSWSFNLIANLAVFPISIIFLVLANMIIDASTKNLWHPPMLGGSWILGPAMGLATLMILSKLPTLIPELIFQIKPSPWGKAIGEEFKPYGAFIGKQGKQAGTDAKNEFMDRMAPGGGSTSTNKYVSKIQKSIYNKFKQREDHK